jgi:hypothetical protein
VALLALAGPAAAQTSVPVSDTWQGALFPEPNVGWVDDTSGLTATGEPYSTGSGIACPQSGQNTNIDHTTWYRLIGTGGRIVLSTNGFSNFDTLVTVYLANAQPNNSTAWLCHDDAGGAQLAELTFSSEAGATYYTQWGGCVNNAGCGNARGTLGYTILTNDQREYAAPAVSRTYANFGATVENSNEPTSCGGIAYGSTVWFRVLRLALRLRHRRLSRVQRIVLRLQRQRRRRRSSLGGVR